MKMKRCIEGLVQMEGWGGWRGRGGRKDGGVSKSETREA